MKHRPPIGFRATWPITNPDLPTSVLIDEAIETLPDLATEAGAVLIGPPQQWRVGEGPDGAPWLSCVAPAWRARSVLPHVHTAAAAAAAGGSLVEFVPCAECDRPAGAQGLCTTHRRAAQRAAAA